MYEGKITISLKIISRPNYAKGYNNTSKTFPPKQWYRTCQDLLWNHLTQHSVWGAITNRLLDKVSENLGKLGGYKLRLGADFHRVEDSKQLAFCFPEDFSIDL